MRKLIKKLVSFSRTSPNISKLMEFLNERQSDPSRPLEYCLDLESLITSEAQNKIRSTVDQFLKDDKILDLRRLYFIGFTIQDGILGINKVSGEVIDFIADEHDGMTYNVYSDIKSYVNSNMDTAKSFVGVKNPAKIDSLNKFCKSLFSIL